MKLTIGMIVKNEEKWLEKCLTAIKPILDNVDSELIITDTGSTDRTVEIAKKFTDKVLHFDWIGDFAAARNTAVDIAQGKWFMFLDADEILGSCDDIVSFFNSGECDKYNSAFINIKSYLGTDGFYCVNHVPRIFRLQKETRFIGIVHEHINTFAPPNRIITDMIEHYGYCYSSKEEQRAKSERNISLLLKQLETDKSNPHIYVQLADSAIESQDKVGYIEQGIEMARKSNDAVLINLLRYRAFMALNMEQYQNAVMVCDEYFAIDIPVRPDEITTDVEVMAIRAVSLYRLGRFSEAADGLLDYFRIFEEYKNGRMNPYDAAMVNIYAATDINYPSYVNMLLVCALNTDRTEELVKAASELPVYKYVEDKELVSALVQTEASVLSRTGYSLLENFYRNLDDDGKKMLIGLVGKAIYTCENKAEMIAALRTTGSEEVEKKAEIYEAFFINRALNIDLIRSFIDKYGAVGDYDLFYIAMAEGYDISPILLAEDTDIARCVAECYASLPEMNKTAEQYNVDLIADNNALHNAALFFECCMKETLNYKVPQLGINVKISSGKLLEQYGRIGQRISSFTDDTAELSSDIGAAAAVGKITGYHEKKMYRECIAEMKNAVALYPDIAVFISDYSKEVIDEYNEYVKTKQQGMTEMQRLALTIKTNIRTFIAGGNIAAAQKTLNEYRSIAPSDPDIAGLQSEIDARS